MVKSSRENLSRLITKMSWKDWPNWLKGGIICAGLYVIVLLVNIDCVVRPAGEPFRCLPAMIFVLPALLILFAFYQNVYGGTVYSFINLLPLFKPIAYVLSLIFYILFFALIGWIYGKI